MKKDSVVIKDNKVLIYIIYDEESGHGWFINSIWQDKEKAHTKLKMLRETEYPFARWQIIQRWLSL